MEDMIFDLELESDAPDGWETNKVLYRDNAGEVIELNVPDDTEGVVDDVGNNQN